MPAMAGCSFWIEARDPGVDRYQTPLLTVGVVGILGSRARVGKDRAPAKRRQSPKYFVL